MPQVREEKQLRRAEHVVSTQQADATILLDVRRGAYYTLNGVGSRIWTLLGDGVTIGAIVERLTDEFEVSREQLSADVADFVQQLHRSKLITH